MASAPEGVPPPRDVAPEMLWRSLLPLQPEQALRYRFDVAPGLRLLVRALPGLFFAQASDEAAAVARDDSSPLRRVIAECLHSRSGGRVFASEDEVAELYQPELAALATAVLEALDIICPRSGRSDRKAWEDRLLEGARHPSNTMLVSALSGCADPLITPKGVHWMPHPERYWGVPVCQLLDGHWLAFEAAMAAVGKT